MALTILVSYETGAKRFKDAHSYSFLGITIGVSISFITGVLLIIFKNKIALLYSSEPEVIALTSRFLLFGAFFQLSDAIQAPIQGALRGYKDVRVTFIMAIISFWIIGLPLGFILANFTILEPFGYWVSLIIGLAIGALTLTARLLYVQKKQLIEQGQHNISV